MYSQLRIEWYVYRCCVMRNERVSVLIIVDEEQRVLCTVGNGEDMCWWNGCGEEAWLPRVILMPNIAALGDQAHHNVTLKRSKKIQS